ncbi:transposable element Tcb1 transposase [Trichonephila clavipes]|nr:transposable element Tcb1 transposase [Trichonephila clavipes]
MESTRYPFHQENIIEQHPFGDVGLLVWAGWGNILGPRIDLHIQIGINHGKPILSDRYSGTSGTFVSGATGAQSVFVNDNAHPHRANIVHHNLQSEDITHIDWPAFSSHLNPVDHVLHMLGRRFQARQLPPTFLPEIRRALFDE